MGVDDRALRFMVDHRTGWATSLAHGLMAADGRPRWLAVELVVCLVAVALLRAWRTAAVAVLAAVVAVGASELLKVVLHRPRPPVSEALVRVDGWSMPSSDGALVSSVAVVLALAALRTGRRVGRVVAAVLAVVTVVVGLALVYLGAHWTSDVLAGWALGTLVGWGCARLLQ